MLQKQIPELSNEVREFFDLLETDPHKLWKSADEFVGYANGCNIADKSFKEFLKTTKDSGTVYATSADALAGYQSYLQSTSKATTLADLKTKALTTSMQLLSTIGWMAAIAASTWLIGKLVGDNEKIPCRVH